MIWTKNGITRKTIIKDSPKDFNYLYNRFSKYNGFLLCIDKNGLHQGSAIYPLTKKN